MSFNYARPLENGESGLRTGERDTCSPPPREPRCILRREGPGLRYLHGCSRSLGKPDELGVLTFRKGPTTFIA